MELRNQKPCSKHDFQNKTEGTHFQENQSEQKVQKRRKFGVILAEKE